MMKQERSNKMDLPKKSLTPLVKKNGPTVVQRRRPPVKNIAEGAIATVKKDAEKSAGPKVITKKATVAAPTATKSMCAKHHKVYVYNAATGYHECPEPGCTKRKRAQMSSAGAPTVVKGDFRIIATQDVDGDWHYHLHYDHLNVVVELPFPAVIGHKVYNSTIDSKVVVNVMSKDVVFIDSAGSVIPIAKVKDR